jgi:hypothetical protein
MTPVLVASEHAMHPLGHATSAYNPRQGIVRPLKHVVREGRTCKVDGLSKKKKEKLFL